MGAYYNKNIDGFYRTLAKAVRPAPSVRVFQISPTVAVGGGEVELNRLPR